MQRKRRRLEAERGRGKTKKSKRNGRELPLTKLNTKGISALGILINLTLINKLYFHK